MGFEGGSVGGDVGDPLRMPVRGWKLPAVVQAFVAGPVISERVSLAVATLSLIRHQQPEIAEKWFNRCHKTEKLALILGPHPSQVHVSLPFSRHRETWRISQRGGTAKPNRDFICHYLGRWHSESDLI